MILRAFGERILFLKKLKMTIKIISIGNKLNSWESESIDYYKKQLPKNLSLDFINLKSLQNPKLSKEEVIKKESELLLSKITKSDFIVSWDIKGDEISSEEFSNFISLCQQTNKSISFIIGGSFGLSSEIKKCSDKVFSASSFTIPHKLFRLILVEQIYRAHTIISNMPYHK